MAIEISYSIIASDLRELRDGLVLEGCAVSMQRSIRRIDIFKFRSARGGEAFSAGTDGESMKLGQAFSIPAYVPPEKVAADEVDPSTARRLRAQ
jgi:hypothetical protein